jgi:hypothetical protein
VEEVLTAAVCFTMSLIGAVVLFRFLKSSALVKNKSYQAGGALAGFVIIYGVLFASIFNMQRLARDAEVASLEAARNSLQEQLTNLQKQLTARDEQLESAVISGRVAPDRGPVQVRLVLDAQTPDSTAGRFAFEVPRVLLKRSTISISAVTDDRHIMLAADCDGDQCELPETSLYLFDRPDTADINVPIRLRTR